MTRTQMRRENPKAGDAGFWNACRMSGQESAAHVVAGSQARQRQTEEEEMAFAPMLLQSCFMISHSQACCCRGGLYMRHSTEPWLTYSMYTHTRRRVQDTI